MEAKAVEHHDGLAAPAQRGDHVMQQCVLTDPGGQGGASWELTHLKVDIGLSFAQDQEMCDPQGPSHRHRILQRIFLSCLQAFGGEGLQDTQ